MPDGNVLNTKEKIVSLLRMNGPSLPVHIAHGTGLSILFASAFLSELLYEGKIRISYLKVGNSPLYFVQGQEYRLERFAQYLKSREKDAFFLIRERKFLKDSEQEPAIRVALRELKDFAIPFKKDEEIYWRYFNVPKEELFTKEIVNEKPKEEIIIKEIVKEIPKEETMIIVQEKKKGLDIFDNSKKEIVEKKKEIIEKKKEKSEFVMDILKFLKNKKIEVIQEIENKKKEFYGIAKIKTDLGEIEVFVIAKEKKKITEDDIILFIQKGQAQKRIVLFVSSGELDKKAIKVLEDYGNIIRIINYNRKP
ncbi:MAG: hypothetical protein NTU63_00940 [Candidatus Pacearchaeota archaeon]|nr:hypothetical protein [Candidatus Pacearchaeota archaeon]